MLNTLNVNLNTDLKVSRAPELGIKIKSQDINNNLFILRFTDEGKEIELDETYTVEILTKFEKSKSHRLTSATVYRDYARWEFDTSFITQDEKVTNYVYVRKSGSLVVSADANAFAFNVGLSEIDKDAGRVAEVYDENYQKYLDEFKENVDFEEIAQAEQERKEAEILRQESYDAKVDAAIVEADVVDKVDNKVTELTPQINNLTAQLAQKENLLGWELQNKVRKIEPMVTFVDDDAYRNVLTHLKPLSETYDIPFVIAAISDRVEKEASHSLTASELRHLQNDLGWEISSHTVNHLNLRDLPDVQQEFEIRQSKETLESMGLKISTICYPYGGTNDKTAEFVRKHYRAGRTTDYRNQLNLAPLETYDLLVTPLGSWFDTWSGSPFPTNSLEFYKHQVDKAIEQKAWLIFLTHVGGNDQHDATQQSYLEQTIQYVKSKNIDVVTLDEGMNRRGNIVDIGRYYKRDLTKEHLVVGADGSFEGSKMQNIAEITSFSSRGAALPKDYKNRKVSYEFVNFSTANAYAFPELLHGNLITFNVNSGTYTEGTFRQNYYLGHNNNVYTRSSIDANTWSSWELLNVVKVLPANSVTITSGRNSFPVQSVSKCRISTGTGMPENTAGVLTTDRTATHNYYIFQMYEVGGKSTLYRRYWDEAQSVWSQWVRVTPLSHSNRNSSLIVKNTGDMIFDTSLGKPVWWNGTSWVDATGASV